MFPKSLALVDDDPAYREMLQHDLQLRGAQVDVFADSNDLIAHREPYGYDFYVIDLMLPGIDGVELIKVLRRRSDAGVLVVSGRVSPDTFTRVMTAGADMYLAKPATFEQIALAIAAVQRRAATSGDSNPAWRLDRHAQQLLAPDGAHVDLSAADLAVLECFIEAAGEVVTRETLRARLGHDVAPGTGVPQADAGDGLNATIYRLRRRIERVTPLVVPLQSKSRVGYVFRAPLTVV